MVCEYRFVPVLLRKGGKAIGSTRSKDIQYIDSAFSGIVRHYAKPACVYFGRLLNVMKLPSGSLK